MNSEPRDTEPFVWSHPSGRCLLQICGGNRLLNELLGAHLAACSHRLCSQLTEAGKSRCSGSSAGRHPCLRLDLIDAADFDLPREWAVISSRMAQPAEHVMVVFFNLPETAPQRMEREALACGVRGLFYRNDSVETLEKGIRAIVSGDVWFRRKTLYRAATGALAKAAVALEPAAAPPPIVTSRERQALACLEQGMTNQEISDRLCVSLHTIKTHLYRAYRKIGARNRHQAARRARELGLAGSAAAQTAGRVEPRRAG
jgi:DNA-binding NarL/FixJ family response regulator